MGTKHNQILLELLGKNLEKYSGENTISNKTILKIINIFLTHSLYSHEFMKGMMSTFNVSENDIKNMNQTVIQKRNQYIDEIADVLEKKTF